MCVCVGGGVGGGTSDSDRSRYEHNPDRVSVTVASTLSLLDVCLNRLEPRNLRMMSCFADYSRFTPSVVSNSSIMAAVSL